LDEEIENNYYDVLEKMVATVPVYMLYCPYGEEAVRILYDELYKA